jgi:hypothetical protein
LPGVGEVELEGRAAGFCGFEIHAMSHEKVQHQLFLPPGLILPGPVSF